MSIILEATNSVDSKVQYPVLVIQVVVKSTSQTSGSHCIDLIDVNVTAQLGETPASDWQSLRRLFARGRLANAAVQATACSRVTVQG